MRTLFPAATMLGLVAFVASAGYAETQLQTVAQSAGAVDAGELAVAPEDGASEDGLSEDGGLNGSGRDKQSELSVPPLSHVEYPDDRPAWIEQTPDLHSDTHTWVVATAGCETISQCEEELDVLTRAAVSLYIKETTGWICPDEFLDSSWIEDNLIGPRYVGTFRRGDTQLHEIAVQLEFDDQARRRIQRAKKNAVVKERLQASGGLFALGLAGLCCTGGLLSVFSRRFS